MQHFDNFLINQPTRADLAGWRRFVQEFLFFDIKEARACLFAGLFFVAVFTVPRAGWFGIPRYDLLLIIAIGIQCVMLWTGLETWDEVKAITLFHLLGFALEVFKTSSAIQSWSYPDFAFTKVFGVPLFSGFMYAAVGSYMIQAWRLLDRDRRMPLLLAFVLIGFFIWLAENISTFYSVWSYPDQLGAWSVVHVAK
jgi:uncharacterized membrane protein YoaT (DUF817 family)